MTIWISQELPLFNIRLLDILCTWIGLPFEKLWPFEFLKGLNRPSVWQVMTIWISRELPLFNFKLLDILCAWIGLPFVKLWPFEFLESFLSSIRTFSIYYPPESDLRVISYDHLNFSWASVVQFRASRYIMRMNRTSVWQVMTIWISRELPFFNIKLFNILCAWIKLPFQKLWPFELLKSFRC